MTEANKKYKAFISYSHEDEKTATWLMSSLESYTLPKSVNERFSLLADKTKPLYPIFRDRDELIASHDLSSAVKEALQNSEFLIVLCSKSSRRSKWVNQEIREFIKLKGNKNILTVILSGEPDLNHKDNCFPPALFEEYDNNNFEPASVDLRANKDGKNLVKLKLVAAMLNLGLNDLIERDSRRQNRVYLTFASLSFVIVLILLFLTNSAIKSRDQAQHNRDQAEDLIEFMLTDLKSELQPVGRLEALNSVAEKVTDYYAVQNLEGASDHILERRSRAFIMLGDVKRSQGYLKQTEDFFLQAFNSTEQLHLRSPLNEQFLFQHSQNAFWLGSLYRQLEDINQAEKYWLIYDELARKLNSIDPQNPEWEMEVAYATINLGILYLLSFNEPLKAEKSFINSLEILNNNTKDQPLTRSLVRNYGNLYAWLADINMQIGHMREVISYNKKRLATYDNWLNNHPDDYSILQEKLAAQLALSRSLLFAGDVNKSLALQKQNLELVEVMIERDPGNFKWLSHAVNIHNELTIFYILHDEITKAEPLIKRIDEILAVINAPHGEQGKSLIGQILKANRYKAMALYKAGKLDEAQGLIAKNIKLIESLDEDKQTNDLNGHYTSNLMVLAEILEIKNEKDERLHILTNAVANLSKRKNLAIEQQLNLQKALYELGEEEKVKELFTTLNERGVAHPKLIQIGKN